MMNGERKLESKQILSFDMYGTLVNRFVDRPEDIFAIVGRVFYEKYGYGIDGFCQKRIESERVLRKSGKVKLTLGDIYQNIGSLTEQEIWQCQGIEEEVEYDLSYPNREGLELYMKYSGSKRIIITTDMYLSRELLTAVLDKCGVSQYSNLFISGESGRSKAGGGALFSYACDQLQISSRELIHIGDQVRSDYLNARRRHVESILLRDRLLRKKKNALERFLTNRMGCCVNQEERIGYYYFGPLTLAYLCWIRQKCREKGIYTLYFFAREGNFLKKVFEKLFGGEVETGYLYVSRRSLTIPLLQEVQSFDELVDLIPLKQRTTVGTFLKKIGVEESLVSAQLQANHIKLDTTVKSIKNPALFFQVIQEKMVCNSKAQYEAICRYFSEVIKGDPIGIVDIGWTGTMQYAFERVLQKAGMGRQVTGFFMGQKREIERYLSAGMENEGFLFGFKDSRLRDVVTSGTALLESVYFAPHGTTVGYQDGQPILAKEELTEETIAHLHAMQDGIWKFAGQCSDLEKKYCLLNKKQIKKQCEEWFKRPSPELADFLGDWEFYDDQVVKLVPKTSGILPQTFIREFLEAEWKVAFLARNLRMRVLNFEIYLLLKKWAEWKKQKKENDRRCRREWRQ